LSQAPERGLSLLWPVYLRLSSRFILFWEYLPSRVNALLREDAKKCIHALFTGQIPPKKALPQLISNTPAKAMINRIVFVLSHEKNTGLRRLIVCPVGVRLIAGAPFLSQFFQQKVQGCTF